MATRQEAESANRMGDRIAYRPVPLKSPTVASACIRLFTLYGESEKTWKNRLYGETSDYHQVARMNAVLRDLGLADVAAEKMVPVYASMEAAPRTTGNTELIAAKADCAEDDAEAEFRANPCEATARVLLRKRAAERQTSLDNDREIAARWGITL